MINYLNRSFVLVLLLVVVSGCEKTVFVDVEDHKRQIVIHALFTQSELWHVNVSSSVGFQDPSEPYSLTNARVEIWENGVLIETLPHTGSGSYVARFNRPRPGMDYMLRVSAPGYDTVEAEASMPTSFVVPSTSWVIVEDVEFSHIDVSVTIDDPGDEENYYAIDVLQLTDLGPSPEPQFIEHRVRYVSNDVILKGIEEVGEEEYTFEVVCFQDVLFDGQTEIINFKILAQFIRGLPTRRRINNPSTRIRCR